MERKKSEKYKDEQIGQSRFSIPRKTLGVVILCAKYELSILYCCGDIVDENCRKKEKWVNIGKNKTYSRKPVLNFTMPLFVVYLYTKYQHFILNGSGDIFEENVLRKDGQTYERTDRCNHPPTFFKAGL